MGVPGVRLGALPGRVSGDGRAPLRETWTPGCRGPSLAKERCLGGPDTLLGTRRSAWPVVAAAFGGGGWSARASRAACTWPGRGSVGHRLHGSGNLSAGRGAGGLCEPRLCSSPRLCDPERPAKARVPMGLALREPRLPVREGREKFRAKVLGGLTAAFETRVP